MGAPITFSCPHCRTILTVPAELAGVSGPCPACGQSITSPQAPAPVQTPIPVPQPPVQAPQPVPSPVPQPAAPVSPQQAAPRTPPPQPAPTAPEPMPSAPAGSPQPILGAPHGAAPAPARGPWRGSDPLPDHPLASRPPRGTFDDRMPSPRVAKGSPWPALLLALVLAVLLGGAAWYLYQHYLNPTGNGQPAGGEFLPPEGGGSNPSPLTPPANPDRTKPTPIPGTPAPAAGHQNPKPPATAPDTADSGTPTPKPEPAAPAPKPGRPAVDPGVPNPDPPEKVVVPGPVDPRDIVSRKPGESLLPLPEESMVKDVQTQVRLLAEAKDAQARLPLVFSETLGTEALGEMLRKGALSRIPPMEYNTVIAYEGPRQGVIQYYVSVSNQAAAPDDTNRELLLHFSNHGGSGFRANADSLALQLQNQLQGFAQDVQAPPLRAHVFIERAHYFAKDAQLPPNHFCINLRYGPFTPVVCQAFVDEGSAPGLDLKPLSGWGEPPKAVVLVLKRKEFAGQPAIVVDQFICANWLQAYPKAPPPVN